MIAVSANLELSSESERDAESASFPLFPFFFFFFRELLESRTRCFFPIDDIFDENRTINSPGALLRA